MARIIEIFDQLERECVALYQPFDQRSGAASDSFDQSRGSFAVGLALNIGRQPIWTIGNTFGALKARASGGLERKRWA